MRAFLRQRLAWIPTVNKYLWIAFLVVILGLPLYVISVRFDLFGLYGGMPGLAEIENPENDLSSEIISADGVSLGRYFRYNRSQVHYNQLSADLVNTLLISEDHRFYEHSGLDVPAYFRVLKGILTFSRSGGGSTLTQQLAKNLYTQNSDKNLDGPLAKLGRFPTRLIQKTKEWIIAVNLEENFTKEEIIALYLNTTNFSSNAFGIKVAAETYFNKQPNQLKLQESAILVGMLQAPSFYNPKRNPKNALAKRNEVLTKIYRHNYKIKTKKQLDSIKALPIEIDYSVQNQNQGIAPYFRAMLGNYLLNFCNSRGIDLYNSGLKIHTTIDSRLQKYANDALIERMKTLQKEFYTEWKSRARNPWVDEDGKEIKDFLNRRIKETTTYRMYSKKYGENSDSLNIMLHKKKPMTIFTWTGDRDTLFSSYDSLNYYKRFLQAGMIAMDPVTGRIKAWVGGLDHKYFKYDHVRQSKRQPGSTFKPFVYGLALESGYSPYETRRDIAPQFNVPNSLPWYPLNSDGTRGSGEMMTLRQAMARSVNSITAQMIQTLGAENVVEFAHRVGIDSKLAAVPSLCLGTSEVSLYEMVDAYCTFVNGGIYIKPIFITSIEDKNGNVIENFTTKTREAISPQTAYKMVYMLRGGVEEEGGTSTGLDPTVLSYNEVGGKTGTTNDASDGWYIGITHDLVAGVWVGGDEPSIHFPSWNFGQGARTARPIWANFMRKAYDDPSTGIKKGRFKRPTDGEDTTLSPIIKNQSDSVQVKDEIPWDFEN